MPGAGTGCRGTRVAVARGNAAPVAVNAGAGCGRAVCTGCRGPLCAERVALGFDVCRPVGMSAAGCARATWFDVSAHA